MLCVANMAKRVPITCEVAEKPSCSLQVGTSAAFARERRESLVPLRNVPTDAAASLAQLIDIRPGQVSSMTLTRNAGFDLVLLAFAPGESVSEEEYFGDTLYYLVEGAACVVFSDSRIALEAGQVLRVPAHVQHAVESARGEGFKLLQLNAHE